MESLNGIFRLEKDKYKKRGLWNFMSIFATFCYFYYGPQLGLYLYRSYSSHDVKTLFAVGSFLIHLIIYITVHSLFMFAYITDFKLFRSWKVTSDPWPWESDPNFKSKLYLTLKTFLFNQFVLIPIVTWFNGSRVFFITDPEKFPSLLTNFYQIIFFVFVEDFFFYWGHRLLHEPLFYRLFHKQHHEFNMTISIASECAHPFEYLIGNMIPMSAGPRIYGHESIHIVTWFLWITYRTTHTAEGHSGYLLPWSPFRHLPFGVSTMYHDYHHAKNKGNFGSFLMFWDTIMGTNDFINKKIN